MTVVAQYMFKPNPGSDLSSIIELVKESAAIWRKHGAQVSFWAVNTGEVGNFVFAVRFENFQAYGTTLDKVIADAEFRAWQAKRLKAGSTSWVRANVASEIDV